MREFSYVLQVHVSGERLVLYALLGYNASMVLNGISICFNDNISSFVVT